jgi:H+/gluconate symporter-like permease
VLLPMALASALKLSQGSGTVAISLAAAIVAPMLPPDIDEVPHFFERFYVRCVWRYRNCFLGA